MSHIDAYLEPCAAFAFEIGPEFNTRIVTRRNRREARNADAAQVRHRARVPFQNIPVDSYRAIKRMFLVCRGCLHTFKLRDPADFEATAEPFGVGDGSETEFQLIKVSSEDGVDYEREIYLPVDVTIYDNGVEVAATINAETGIVTFAVPPVLGHVLTWSGQFDLKVRFALDYLPFSIDNKNPTSGYILNGACELIEVPA